MSGTGHDEEQALARAHGADRRGAPIPDGIELVVFDADNTLRRTTVAGKPCPHADGEWELMPGVRDVLARVPWGEHGPQLGIASNQDQIAYGHLTEHTARALLSDMVAAATGGQARAPAIRCCPHALDVACECRKPAPGMLIDIMRHFGVLPEHTLFVGDAATDLEAAMRARVRFLWAADFFGWRSGSA